MERLSKLMKILKDEEKTLLNVENDNFSEFSVEVRIAHKTLRNTTITRQIPVSSEIQELIKIELISKIQRDIEESKKVILEELKDFERTKEYVAKVEREIEEVNKLE